MEGEVGGVEGEVGGVEGEVGGVEGEVGGVEGKGIWGVQKSEGEGGVACDGDCCAVHLLQDGDFGETRYCRGDSSTCCLSSQA